MELLLCQIIRHVQEGMPELSVVDENYGQLENLSQPDTDMYPLTFPAVLIDLQEATWSNTADNCQKGTVRVCVQLLIDCYDDTHATSGTMETVRQRAAVAERLHALLQGYRPMQDGRLVRETSRFYTATHGIKVYETVYSVAATSTVKDTQTACPPHSVELKVKLARDTSA